jgi:aminopeptidase
MENPCAILFGIKKIIFFFSPQLLASKFKVSPMHDPRYDQLSHLLTSYSTELQPGERVLIELFDVPAEMGTSLIRAARARGAIPYINLYDSRIQREMLRESTEKQLHFTRDLELRRMKGIQAYIAIRGANNIFESSDVPTERMKLASKILRPVMDWRVKKTKWVVLRWPTSAMAQQALMSTSSFEDFYFRVCTLDYGALVPAMERLKKRMDQTDQVHLKGPGTDLRFSIKDIGSVICGGKRNIPLMEFA